MTGPPLLPYGCKAAPTGAAASRGDDGMTALRALPTVLAFEQKRNDRDESHPPARAV
ncbi:hypothetical protein MIAR_20810 [Microbacterium arabinogalactanolyticum]|uniref:hypothetical protein n=1 Tax=Microbacterium arabinogalactanolyticum TaxID=69365 RepID=UPI0031DF99BD|nr:hypothetical protein MIAR_20810 [Microbacterium arabinogalactanolyticum]